MKPLARFSSLTMKAPTVRDNSLPATPRRIRLKAPHLLHGEVLDFYVGRTFFARVGSERIEVRPGTYVGGRAIISHEFVMTHLDMWEKVEEPFHLVAHQL